MILFQRQLTGWQKHLSEPQLSQYQKQEEFYSTVFHELTHSTGHRSCLNRLADVRPIS
ncbi:MAG: hypothetical protein IJI09_12515 [Clostridia bacterium]|nr:hypothetical protein [Clostridia bacterium]